MEFGDKTFNIQERIFFSEALIYAGGSGGYRALEHGLMLLASNDQYFSNLLDQEIVGSVRIDTGTR
jgi:hypothetical protein